MKAGLALFSFFLGVVTTGALQAAGHDPFQVVNGDGWWTTNANYNDRGWYAFDSARPAFGLQLGDRNDMPFDRGTASAAFWVHNPGCRAFKGFADPCGWQLGLAITQYRSIVVGGQAMELDGLSAPAPYARVVNSFDDGTHVVGLSTNAFADFSGVDNTAALPLGRRVLTICSASTERAIPKSPALSHPSNRYRPLRTSGQHARNWFAGAIHSGTQRHSRKHRYASPRLRPLYAYALLPPPTAAPLPPRIRTTARSSISSSWGTRAKNGK
jgi:hypothetical protein